MRQYPNAAGAVIPLHHHTGTQVAYIDAGTLTYTVKTGSVPVYKGAADGTQKLVRRITAGAAIGTATGAINTGRAGYHSIVNGKIGDVDRR